MSRQDNERCSRCHVECGYDDGKIYLSFHEVLCGKHADELAAHFMALLGENSYSSNSQEIMLEWSQVDRVLKRLVRNEVTKTSYLEVTDAEVYRKVQRV